MSRIAIRRNGVLIISFEDWTEGSVRSKQIMDHDYIKVEFSLENPIHFKLGDYIETEYGRFEITDKTTIDPKINSETGGYDYTLQFDAEYIKWKNKILKYTPNSEVSELTFSLTAELSVHMGIFMQNLQSLCKKDSSFLHNGVDDWEFSIDSAIVEQSAKLIEYDGESLADVLNTYAETWNCEWWVSGSVIYFGRCEHSGEPTVFELGENVVEMTATDSKKDFATRLYVFGGTKNIPANYRELSAGSVANSIVQKRLMMPEGTPYLQSGTITDEQEVVEAKVFFDDIYPHVECVVNGVSSYTSTVTNEDGTETTQTFYRIGDSSGFLDAFTEDMILEGGTLMVTFTSGPLNLMEFELRLVEDDEELGKCFEIIANEDYGVMLPEEPLIPESGNTYVVYGWDSTKMSELPIIGDAERELEAEGMKYMQTLFIDPNNFKCGMDSEWMENEGVTRSFDIGDQVELVNPAILNNRVSRIIGFEFPLDMPWSKTEYIVGENAKSSRFSALEEKIDEVKNSISKTVLEGKIDLIRSYDKKTPTDENVYSAMAARLNFLKTKEPDTANKLITFLEGITSQGETRLNKLVEIAANLISNNFDSLSQNGFGIIRDQLGGYSLFIKNLIVWGKAVFNELELRKFTVVNGNFVFSPAGSKIISVESIDSQGNLCEESGNPVYAYRCKLCTDDGTTATVNGWELDDQAKCQEFNIREGVYENVSNTNYWRRVVSVGYVGNIAYVDLSHSDCDPSIVNDVPKAGDTIVCMGNKTNKKRGNLIIITTIGNDGLETEDPSIQMFSNVNTYSLGKYTKDGIAYNNRSAIISPEKVHFATKVFKVTDWRGIPYEVYSFKGEFDPELEDFYGYNDEVIWDGKSWVGIYTVSPYPKGCYPGQTIGGITYWKLKVDTSKNVYDAYLSDYTDTIVVDSDGNCEGGLWSREGEDVMYRLHSSIFATKNGEALLYEEPEPGELPSALGYAVRFDTLGCTAILRDGVIYITGIDNVRDGVAGSDDDLKNFDWDAMRDVHKCMVTATITFPNGAEKYLEMPVVVNHIPTSYIRADIDNEMFTWSWSESQKTLYGGKYTAKIRCYHENTLLTDLLSCSCAFENEGMAGVVPSCSVVKEGDDAYVKLEVEPANNNIIIDAKYILDIYLNVMKAGVPYEKVVKATLVKNSNGATYDIIPSASEIIATYDENGVYEYSPSSVTCKVLVTDEKGIHTVEEKDLGYYGLTIEKSANAMTDELKEIVLTLKKGHTEVDKKSIPIIRQPNGIKDTLVHYGISDSNIVPPTEWSTTIPERSDEDLDKYLWTRVTIIYLNGTTKVSYTQSLINQHGYSAFKSSAFKRSASKPAKPTGGTFLNPVPTTEGWSDGIPPEDEDKNPAWISTRVFTSDGKAPQTDEWSEPQICADTATIDRCYSSQETKPGNPTSHGVQNDGVWHNDPTEYDIWMAMSTKVGGQWGNWEITKIKGEKGDEGESAFQISQTELVFPTHDNGSVDYTNKTIYFSATYKGATASVEVVSIKENSAVNCTASVLNNGVAIYNIPTKKYGLDGNEDTSNSVPEEEAFYIPATSGSAIANVICRCGSVEETLEVAVRWFVNVQAYMGKFYHDNRQFNSTLVSVQGNLSNMSEEVTWCKSEINQTAEKITAEVSTQVNGLRTEYAGLGIGNSMIAGKADSFALYNNAHPNATVSDILNNPSGYAEDRVLYWDGSKWVFKGEIQADGGTFNGFLKTNFVYMDTTHCGWSNGEYILSNYFNLRGAGQTLRLPTSGYVGARVLIFNPISATRTDIAPITIVTSGLIYSGAFFQATGSAKQIKINEGIVELVCIADGEWVLTFNGCRSLSYTKDGTNEYLIYSGGGGSGSSISSVGYWTGNTLILNIDE